MGKKKDREFWESAELNNATYQYYYDRLIELGAVMFEYQNMPEEIDLRYMELQLLARGSVCFFKDDVLGYLALPVAAGGQLSVYNIPLERTAYASNGYQRTGLDDTNSVIIFNDYLHKPSMPKLELFARRLWQCDRVADVNIAAQKTPVLVTGTESQMLTLKNLYMKYDGNAPVIFGDKFLDSNALKVLKTDAPFVADKLRQEKDAIWNEALTYLGISNVNFVKKERLVSDEVVRNQGGTIASRYSRLEMRQQAVDQINKMFGLNITVDYREDYREQDDSLMEDENGEQHTVTKLERGEANE